MRICIPNFTRGAGGPVTFRWWLSNALVQRGFVVTDDISDRNVDALLLLGGTRRLSALRRHKRAGVRIVQRLDGINWRQRVQSPWSRTAGRARVANLLMRCERDHYADNVVYQSEFSRRWWHGWHGAANCRETVIHNGVDLNQFSPAMLARPQAERKMVCVEGRLSDDQVTISLLAETHRDLLSKGWIGTTVLCGQVSSHGRAVLSKVKGLELRGELSRDQVRAVLQQADIFLSLDLNPACPNAVIEAMAAGLPIVGYDTGALAELILPGGGLLAPYLGNLWRLELPSNLTAPAEAAATILAAPEAFRLRARALAEENHKIDTAVDRYVQVLTG